MSLVGGGVPFRSFTPAFLPPFFLSLTKADEVLLIPMQECPHFQTLCSKENLYSIWHTKDKARKEMLNLGVCVFRTFTSSFGQIICWAKKSSYLPAEQPLWPHDIAYYKRAWHWRWWLCPASSTTISIHPSKAWKILLTSVHHTLLPYLHFWVCDLLHMCEQ